MLLIKKLPALNRTHISRRLFYTFCIMPSNIAVNFIYKIVHLIYFYKHEYKTVSYFGYIPIFFDIYNIFCLFYYKILYLCKNIYYLLNIGNLHCIINVTLSYALLHSFIKELRKFAAVLFLSVTYFLIYPCKPSLRRLQRCGIRFFQAMQPRQ